MRAKRDGNGKIKKTPVSLNCTAGFFGKAAFPMNFHTRARGQTL